MCGVLEEGASGIDSEERSCNGIESRKVNIYSHKSDDSENIMVDDTLIATLNDEIAEERNIKHTTYPLCNVGSSNTIITGIVNNNTNSVYLILATRPLVIVGLCTVMGSITRVCWFGRIFKWAPVGICHAWVGDGGTYSPDTVTCPKKNVARLPKLIFVL
ncbi:DNA-directed RNA polymerase II subunit RPB11 isoform X1 [Aphis craccivora]|uniref:DNA-directed RNA polymerase II subunit RPB11 isoform X1 n=1 Tax=Aphis craccivora TaxID=307492 RepID=A0A6G0W1M1_APHCR|nr:DNA-directed RNA polymerase II subunit RPB11 isoform X1 [Aphis craccivora]